MDNTSLPEWRNGKYKKWGQFLNASIDDCGLL